MHLAALYSQRGVAEYLLAKGADVNAVARHSGTPLDAAYESKNPGLVEWLQSKGARFTPIRFDVAALAGNTTGLAITRESEPLKGRSGRTLPAPYTLRAGGADIKLIPRPGLHSDADLIVYFPKESVVAMGDLLLSESMPAVTDIPGYLAFLEDVLDVFPDNTTFVSGHGRDLTAAGVKAYRDTLNTIIGIVRTNLAAGRTAEQMVRDGVLKAYEVQYSLLDFMTPDTLIPTVVTALKQGTLK